MKKCKKCEGNNFYKSGHCVRCHSKHVKNWQKRNKENTRKASRKWYAKDKDREIQRTLAWQKKHPENVRQMARRRRFKKYGLTEAQFQEMLLLQENKCGICRKFLEKEHEQHIDHNHKTGQVRMVLCPKCNTGLGNFQEIPELLEIAAAYLRGFLVKF